MNIIVDLLGAKGIMALIGIIVFLFSYKHSIAIFDWIERQTLGTRTYILEKFEILFIEVKSEHVTYALLSMSIGSGVLVLCILGMFGQWIIGLILSLIVGYLGFKIPKPFIDYLVEKRIKDYSNQMVDALTLLANGIRAGLSVPQSLAMVVDEMPTPISQEFNVILQQNKIGVPLEECFENLAERIPTEDNDMFVTSINILRETGGNLAEVFDTIVGVIRERVRLGQKIDQLTASGMFQGYTIASMPVALGTIFYFSDPEGMKPMFTTSVGWILVIAAATLDLAGLYVILKIVKVKV